MWIPQREETPEVRDLSSDLPQHIPWSQWLPFSSVFLGFDSQLKFYPSPAAASGAPFLCGLPSRPLGLALDPRLTASQQPPTQHYVYLHIFSREHT